MAAQAIPALIALLFKLALLAYAVRAPRRDASTRLFVALLTLFSVHNVIEVLGLSHFAHDGLDERMVQYGYAYFATLIPVVAVMVHLSLRISIDDWNLVRPIVPFLYLPVLLLEYLLLATNQLISGFQPFNDVTILRTPGSLYVLFEVYAIIYVVAGLSYLIYGARRTRPSAANRLRNRWWLVALLPVAVLHLYLVIANHFGIAKLPSTMTVPIALTLFLAITTYAMHNYRLFDITFFVPGSRARQRKRSFYAGIRKIIGEIASLRSTKDALQRVANVLDCQLAVLGTPNALFAAPAKQPIGDNGLHFYQFPPDALRKVNRLVVAPEIKERNPDLSALMAHYGVGAIVPFKSPEDGDRTWLLLDHRFCERVYSPRDFDIVKALFATVSAKWADDAAALRAELEATKAKLADAEERLEQTEEENLVLRDTNTRLFRETARRAPSSLAAQSGAHWADVTHLSTSSTSSDGPPPWLPRLEEYLRQSLQLCRGDVARTASTIGMQDVKALELLLEQLGITPSDYRANKRR